MNNANDFQRASIFQTGGSLGSYEAGAYRAFYELLSERAKKIGGEEHLMNPFVYNIWNYLHGII